MLDFDDNKHCLFSGTGENVYKKQLMFQNRLHEVHTVEVNKVALNRGSQKRIVQSNGVSMLAYGHKDVKVEDSAMSVFQWL